MTLIITVDGTASSGKGTLCRSLARRHEWLPLESGLLYRSLARAAQEKALSEVLATHSFDDLQDEVLRSEAVAMAASNIAKDPAVRKRVNEVLHSLAAHLPSIYHGMIVDGRDIGTVVFPQADVKFFLTADVNIRQQRRTAEMGGNPAGDISQRDAQDANRTEAPLVQAEDACLIDTTHMTIEDVRDEAERWISFKLGADAPAGIRARQH